MPGARLHQPCRPEGRYVNRRKLPGRRGPVVPTQPFHSGEYTIRPLNSDEDEARGFITGLVATEKHMEAKFRLQPSEGRALQTVLPTLRQLNPWHEAHCSSLRDVRKLEEFVEVLHAEGCIAPRVPQAVVDATGQPLVPTWVMNKQPYSSLMRLSMLVAVWNGCVFVRMQSVGPSYPGPCLLNGKPCTAVTSLTPKETPSASCRRCSLTARVAPMCRGGTLTFFKNCSSGSSPMELAVI